MSDPAFCRALDFFGGNHSAMAKALGTSQQRISYIAKQGNSVPPDLVLQTERVTGISRHIIRPDLYPTEASDDRVEACGRCGDRVDDPRTSSCTSVHCPLREKVAA